MGIQLQGDLKVYSVRMVGLGYLFKLVFAFELTSLLELI